MYFQTYDIWDIDSGEIPFYAVGMSTFIVHEKIAVADTYVTAIAIFFSDIV